MAQEKNEKEKVPQRVEVEVFGDSFALKTDDPEYMQNLAKMVDQEMRKVARTVHSFDSTKIAILTALHLADEYWQLKREHDDLRKLFDEM